MTTILLAEDDDEVRMLIREMLRRRGFRVLQARNGREALSRFDERGGQIDLLITDVVMPRMSGSELADILTALRPGLRVLYISGYLGDQLQEHGICHDEPNFLQKPFTQDELIAKVDEVVAAEPRKARAISGIA